MSVDNKDIIYNGKEKTIYSTSNPSEVIVHFKDVVTAFGGIKRARLKDKGKYNNLISALVFEKLEKEGVKTHFISLEGEREQLCRKVEPIPLQLIVRNRLCGTTARLLSLEEGTEIPNVVYELRYNNDELGDPMINSHHAVALGLATYAELGEIFDIARKTNFILIKFFHGCGIELIDFKMEFGRSEDGSIIVSDEISPDNARLWDEATGRKLDKDRFRHDLSDVCASYREIYERIYKSRV